MAPSILLIPGGFAPPDMYTALTDTLVAIGLSVQTLSLPSIGPAADTPGPATGSAAPTMYDDAAHISQAIRTLLDSSTDPDGTDVVLIAHSYGGAPMTESVKGLEKSERVQQGKKGGVVGLGYMTALVPGLGQTAGSVLADVPAENKLDLKADDNGWMYHDDIAPSASIVFSRLAPDLGQQWIKKFPRHSAASFGSELTHAGYKNLPVSYLFCEEDRCIPPKNQQIGIDLIERESGRKVHVTRIKADHCPNVEMPDVVVDWVLDIVTRMEEV